MFRLVVILLVMIILITLLRGVIGLLAKGLSEVLQPTSPEQRRAQRPDVPLQGELKRDPVCGTYVSTASSVKKSFRGEVVHFCSESCRDRYRPS